VKFFTADVTAVDVDVAPDGTNLGPGTEPYVTLLHEIGHALGLSHTDSGESQSGVSLSPAEQTTDATVMNSTFPDFNPGDFTELVRPHSLMIYDVAALQYLYGANTTFRTGNDTYEFNGGTTEARTIWDAGGIDTYSTVTFTGNAVIDLREGFENVTQVSHAAGTGSFIWSAFGANIENATAGGGNDSIFGNSLNNRLRGNDGNDSIVAGAGDDDLNGNRGADSIMGGDGNDIVRGGKDNDTVHGDAGMDDIHGDVGDDIVFGGADNDMVNGNIGSDIIIGDSGNDTIRGGQGDDQIFGGEGIDTIFGDKGNDRLNGGGGGDIFIFRPGFGADILEGFDLPGAGIGDRLQISSSLATTASEVLGKATLNADSVFIDFTGGNTITILGISTLGLDDITIV
jgi:serralysin